jgi:DNA-binding NarL/FixJ family response regulator
VEAVPIRILAVDQNPLLRDGLRMLIHLQPDMELAGMAASGPEAVQRFAEIRPDATLIDLDLPYATGIVAIQQILMIDPAACVIGLYTYDCDQAPGRALSAGARTCVTKDRLNEDLLPLIRNCRVA